MIQLDLIVVFRLVIALLYWSYLSYLLLLSQPWVAIEAGSWTPSYQPDLSATLPSLGLHFFCYFLGASLTLWSLEGTSPRWIAVAVVMMGIHAIGLEWAQNYIPFRWFSISDLVFNLAGISMGLGFTLRWLQPHRAPSVA